MTYKEQLYSCSNPLNIIKRSAFKQLSIAFNQTFLYTYTVFPGTSSFNLLMFLKNLANTSSERVSMFSRSAEIGHRSVFIN